MARKTSPSKARPKLLLKTCFIVYRTAQGYWIAGAKDGRIVSAFPVRVEDSMRGRSISPAGHA
jgi:hypothetical protein